MMGRKHLATIAILSLLLGLALGFIIHWWTMPTGTIKELSFGARGPVDASPRKSENRQSQEPTSAVRLSFETSNALEHLVHLSSVIGYRPEGSPAEEEAASYIASCFENFGYEEVHKQTFRLDNGALSSNVFVVDPGTRSTLALVVGAHYDSAGGTGSPGANDNASGVGVVLELARIFRNNENAYTLIFVAFGAEEILQGYGKDHHHYGSRYMAAHLQELGYTVVGMISLDMVGVGSTLTLNSTMQAPQTLVNLLDGYARRSGLNPVFRQDPGWSDHEAFEKHGIPSVWVEYREDPNYHSPADTYDKIDPSLIARTGQLLQGFLESLNDADLQALSNSTLYR